MGKCLHFVGLWDQDADHLPAFNNAVKVFGPPDFVHRHWDHRAVADVAPGDKVVFGTMREWQRYLTDQPEAHAFNDSEMF